MRLVCGPETLNMSAESGALRVVLYGQPGADQQGSAGAAAMREIRTRY